MEILGIGPSELIFIIILAIIILGPNDMQKAGRTIGAWLNQLVNSEGWRAFQRTSREIRNLPTSLMRSANVGLDEATRDIQNVIDPNRQRPSRSIPEGRASQPSAPSSPPAADSAAAGEPLSPAAEPDEDA
jgi:sec-independent protein translocase protein TatB